MSLWHQAECGHSVQFGEYCQTCQWNKHQAELDLVKAQLAIALEALEYYADSYTWVSNSGKVGCNPINFDYELIPGTHGASRLCGGVKARLAITKIKEMK